MMLPYIKALMNERQKDTQKHPPALLAQIPEQIPMRKREFKLQEKIVDQRYKTLANHKVWKPVFTFDSKPVLQSFIANKSIKNQTDSATILQNKMLAMYDIFGE